MPRTKANKRSIMTSKRYFTRVSSGSSKSAALRHFKTVDPHFHSATADHHALLPSILPAKRTRQALFEALIETVISQQLGVAAADTIYARVKEACNGRVTSLSILKIKREKLRAAGLSGAKMKTLKEI